MCMFFLLLFFFYLFFFLRAGLDTCTIRHISYETLQKLRGCCSGRVREFIYLKNIHERIPNNMWWETNTKCVTTIMKTARGVVGCGGEAQWLYGGGGWEGRKIMVTLTIQTAKKKERKKKYIRSSSVSLYHHIYKHSFFHTWYTALNILYNHMNHKNLCSLTLSLQGYGDCL